MKKSNKNWLFKRFGPRKVFVVFTVCFFVTLMTMLSSIILTFTAEEHTTEKLIEHIALCIIAIVLSWIPVFLRSRFHFNIPSFLQIVITLFIVAHFVLGEVYRFYDYLFFFDKALHITAGAVISLLGFSIVYGFSKNKSGSVRLSPFFVALFSFCFALTILALWEVFEYGMDSLFRINMQRWQDGFVYEAMIDGEIKLVSLYGQGSGLVDTMTDIIVGILGAAVICFMGGLYIKKYPDNTKFFITKISTSVNSEANPDNMPDLNNNGPEMAEITDKNQSDMPYSNLEK